MLQIKIENKYKEFSRVEKIIANYLLQNYSDIPKMTSYEIANNIDVGQSSVIRFVKKLGYGSFRELLADINVTDNKTLNYEEILPVESIEITNEKVLSRYYEIIALTKQYNSPDIYNSIIEILKKSQNIVCFGVGHSNYYAEYLASQLLIGGISTKSFTNSHLIYSEILLMQKNDVLIVFSETGESREIIYAAKEARKKGIKVIAVTKKGESNLQKLADISLYTVNYDVRRMLTTTTIRCSQLFVIDTLLLNLFKTRHQYYKDKSESGREIINEVFPKMKNAK